MKIRVQNLSVALALLALSTFNSQLSTTFAQGTAFTYQGQLQNNGSPASGTYNLTFSLFNTDTSSVAVAGPVTNNGVIVTNGLFTVLIDFGPGVFTGQTNWLEISVATNGVSTFTTLTPRQELTPTPYAIYAENASGLSGTLSASQLTSIGNTNGDASDNFFVGQSGNSTMSGYYNTADGDAALVSNTTGIANTANGAVALLLNTNGSYNVADGAFAMNINTSGSGNVAVGYYALGLNTNGSGNIALGDQAGNNITSGNDNIDIGNAGVAGDNSIIRIGDGQSQTFIAGVINGNGGGLSSLNAANLTGPVPASSLTSVPVGSLTGTIPQSNLGIANSYTPTIGDGTYNFSTSTQDGYYVIVGNLVYFEIWLKWTSKGSATSTSSLRISLPFTMASERVGFSLAYLVGFTFSNELTAGANNGASYILLYNLFEFGGVTLE